MDRRTTIKRLSIFGGGLLVAPGCRFSSDQVTVALDNLNITAAKENLLATIVDSFIPATDMPGASDLNAHHFVLVMVDDCRPEEDQQVFTWELQQIDSLSNNLVLYAVGQHGLAFFDQLWVEAALAVLRDVDLEAAC